MVTRHGTLEIASAEGAGVAVGVAVATAVAEPYTEAGPAPHVGPVDHVEARVASDVDELPGAYVPLPPLSAYSMVPVEPSGCRIASQYFWPAVTEAAAAGAVCHPGDGDVYVADVSRVPGFPDASL
jgi:hypothetical protein